MDSMPDTWGRTLMKRRESQLAIEENRKPHTLYDIDFLLGVYDESRMGALRFKTKIDGPYHTFLTKRFDRLSLERIHFASAMTMTGNNEEILRDVSPSYLELAEFIQYSGANSTKDLHQLWRRIVFNIAISNTDDHMRNHGFLLKENGWHLSPAYDINPSVDKDGLAININSDNNSLDFDLAISVGEYFQLNSMQMRTILDEVLLVVSQWKIFAKQIGISRKEMEIMEAAFRF